MQSARKTQFIWLIKAKLYIEIFIPIWTMYSVYETAVT